MTVRIYAHVVDDVVENVILVDPDSGFPMDDLVDVTDLDPQPGIGWTRDGKHFTPPAPAEPEPTTAAILDASTADDLTAQITAAKTVADVKAALTAVVDALT